MNSLTQLIIGQESIAKKYLHEKMQEDNIKKEEKIKQQSIIITHEILQKRNNQRIARESAIEDQAMFVDEDDFLEFIIDVWKITLPFDSDAR